MNIRCKSGKAKIIGSLVCIVGGLLLVLYKGVPLFDQSHSKHENQSHHSHFTRTGSEKWTLGCIALSAGTIFWSSWFVVQSKIGNRYPCQYTSTAIVTFFGAIQSAILSFSTSRELSVWVPRGNIEIFSVLYSVSIITFLFISIEKFVTFNRLD